MKKLSVVLILGALVMIGCEVASYSVSVENNFTESVTYEYNGYENTLETGKKAYYTVGGYTPAPIVKSPVPKEGIDPETQKPYPRIVRVTSEDGGMNYIFVDAKKDGD